MERDEIELGEVVPAKVSPTPGFVLAVRLDYDDAGRLFALADRQGRSSLEIVTDLVRQYVRAEVPDVPAG